ncbi:MAG: MBOAT family O-acyltransferase [Bacteroidales bacterium]
MLFTSFTFAFFFLLVFFLYWFVFSGRLRWQNLFLLATSYVFYGWVDWRFALLLLAISLVNYGLAIVMDGTSNLSGRKLFFSLALIANIGTLVVFKYAGFFITSFANLLSLFAVKQDPFTLNIILPAGISFYIFLSLSYIIDVYQQKLAAVRNMTDVLLAFSFFPIILAGPIHRPIGLLPQIQRQRNFSYDQAVDGLKQVLWGVFMKILIADHCAVYVNTIFSNSANFPGSMLLTGIFLFTIQIYADFAGYSNMAIGISKLLGFSIMKNFAYPYFARDIKVFWTRWNISLTNWFRDYVFLPVAYASSRRIKSERFLGIHSEVVIYLTGLIVTWVLTGLWHGANYTFIVWGLIHATFLFLYHISFKPRKRWLKRWEISNNNVLFMAFETALTMVIVMFAWIFFRADNLGQAFAYISGIASWSLFQSPQFALLPEFSTTFAFIILFLVMEWLGREHDYAIERLGYRWPKALRWSMYYLLIITIFWFAGERQQFIYFQF